MNDSKEHIIIVACKLFLQKNYKEVTMKEIVEKTGLSKGAFYHYFISKEQLFLEALDYFFTNVMTHIYENYSKESFYKFYHDYANEVKAYCNRFVTIFKEEENDGKFGMNYFTLAFDALKLFPEFKDKMILEQEKELKTWIDVVSSARTNGEIKSSLTDEEIAQIFLFVGDGVSMHMIMEGIKIEEMINPILTFWDKLYETMKA